MLWSRTPHIGDHCASKRLWVPFLSPQEQNPRSLCGSSRLDGLSTPSLCPAGVGLASLPYTLLGAVHTCSPVWLALRPSPSFPLWGLCTCSSCCLQGSMDASVAVFSVLLPQSADRRLNVSFQPVPLTQARSHSAGPSEPRYAVPFCTATPRPGFFPSLCAVAMSECAALCITVWLTLLECGLARAGPPQALFTVCLHRGLWPYLLGGKDVPW